MTDRVLDLVIVGAGPTGINIGVEAKNNNIDYIIFEKGVLVNSIYNFPSNMIFFSTSKNIEIAGVPFISHTDKPTRKEALEYYRRIYESNALNISLYHKIEDVSKKKGFFEIRGNQKSYKCKNVVICTGYFDNPKLLNIPGENLGKVRHYYDEVHPYLGQKIVVVGAANSACDVALETWQKGAEVTMVVRKPTLSKKVKYWILPNINNRIKEGSINAYFNSNLLEIREKSVLISTESKDVIEIENDFVLAMTGYKPSFSLLESAGVRFSEIHRKPIYNHQTLETNVSGLYVAGVLNGGLNTSQLFIENTRHHAELIINSVLAKKKNNKILNEE